MADGITDIVLRRVYAVDPDTGLKIPAGQILLTDTVGRAIWTDILSSLTIAGGPILNSLPSTINTFSSQTFNLNSVISSLSSVFLQSLCSIGAQASGASATMFTANLGSILGPNNGYVSTATLSTFVGQAVSTLTQSPSTIASLIPALSSFQYANSSTLSSFAASINSANNSTVIGLSQIGYITSPQLTSTVGGLGEIGYASTTINFTSTVAGLGSIGYISTATLNKKFDTLGNWYVSSLSMASTVDGLSSFGYVTNINLSSAIGSISTMKNNIRFDTVTNVTVIGGTNTFTNTTNLIYVSTFYQSSMVYSGARPGLQIQGNMVTDNDMEFSTANIRLDALSSFIDARSRITIDVFPTYAFTKLGTGATAPAMLYMSTMLKYGATTLLSNTTTTSAVFAGTTRITYENNSVSDSSNIFNQPIRLSIPQGTILNYQQPYTLYHYMPNSIQKNQLQNALHSNLITPYFGSTGSIFVSVQNSV
jgi:hypothetical protein